MRIMNYCNAQIFFDQKVIDKQYFCVALVAYGVWKTKGFTVVVVYAGEKKVHLNKFFKHINAKKKKHFLLAKTGKWTYLKRQKS